MSLRKVAMWSAIGFAGLVAALIVTVLLFDWNMLRDYAGRHGSDAAGRDFAIRGDLDVDFGLTTTIRAQGIVLANAEWGSEPEMANIEEVVVSIRLPELLRGRLELPEVILRKPRILLEKSADGTQSNWDFGAAEATTPDERTEFPLIGRLVVEEGAITYREPARGIDLQTQVATAVGLGGDSNEMVELKGHGTFQKEPFHLDVRAGSLLTLRDGDQPYPIEIDAAIGETKAKLNGTLQEPLAFEGVDVQMTVSGPDPAKLFPIVGIPIPSTPPYELSGRLRRQATIWTFADFAGKVGDSDLAGTASVDIGPERPVVKAELQSRTIDFNDLGGMVGAAPGTGPGNTASKEQKERAAKAEASGRIIPDTPLDFEQIRAVDADVTFQGGHVKIPAVPLQKVSLHLKLDNGRLSLDPLNFSLANGKIATKLVLDGRGKVAATTAELDIRQVSLKELLGATPFAKQSSGLFGGQVKLAGRGNSLREALASADGTLTLLMTDGRFSNLLLELAGIDIAESLGLLLAEDQSIAVRCVVADLAVEQGVVSPKILVIDTTDTNVTGEGKIDLGQEAMDLRLAAHPKDPSIFSARTPVRLTGTFAEPKVRPEATGLAARGGAAIALGVLLTPLAAIIPFIEPGLGEDSNCTALVENARQTERKPAPQPPASRR